MDFAGWQDVGEPPTGYRLQVWQRFQAAFCGAIQRQPENKRMRHHNERGRKYWQPEMVTPRSYGLLAGRALAKVEV